MSKMSASSNDLRSRWHRVREQLGNALRILRTKDAERRNALEKANDDLKAAQADLQRRWQYLAEAQKLSHSGTFGWKVTSGELVWSEETRNILCFDRETNPTLDLAFDRIHPEDRDRMQKLREHAINNGIDFDVEHRILLPDGIIKYVHAVAHAGRDGLGNLEYMGVITDMTERKRADDERRALALKLEESNARLEEAQRVAHVGHWEWDLETNVILWSDETYRIFGLSPQERPMDMATNRGMIHPDDREALYGGVDVDLSAGTYPIAEFRVVRPDGEVRTVHAITSKLRGGPLVDSSGESLEWPRKLFGTLQDVTERKRAEEERQALSRDLQESKDWLEEAQRLAHIGYYKWNLITGSVTWSDELYRIYGLDPKSGSIDIAMIHKMIHPDDRDHVFRTAEKAIQEGAHTAAEHRIIRPDGEVRTIQGLGTVKRDASGVACEMFGTAQDITDRKRAEEALQRSQFYLSEGERLAHTGSWAFNDSGHYWSDELYKIYGLDPKNGAPTVEQYLALIHPQDRAAIAESIQRMLDEHRGFDQIERIIRPDGQLRYLRAVAVPVVEQGVFKGFIGTTMDVTEQELLTQELRRERAYLAEGQGLTHIGSWATNFHTGKNHHVSDEIYRLHGFEPSQGPVSLEDFWKTVHSEDGPAVRAVIENAIRTRTDYDIPEFRICLPDGTVRFLRTIGHHNPLGEIGEYVGITMDITERKRAEDERERLRQLENDLAHINRVNMMGELAAALAHEIKQPIAASITSANALLRWLAHEPPDLERARATASRIEQDANRAANVIDSLRSFYKTGTFAERQIIDVNEIVGDMTVLLSWEADRHAIAIHSELESDTPKILANRVQLQQVFMNLMLNAIEAMKDTGGELTIRSRSTPDGLLSISISDTGTGLPTGSVEQLFEPFHTTKPQGTGMGLTITRSIVESCGGRVWATANLSKGASFHFVLPRETETQV
ncbi:PAS domain-containing sensor histidine kinase [Rhodanobacter koreensis]